MLNQAESYQGHIDGAVCCLFNYICGSDQLCCQSNKNVGRHMKSQKKSPFPFDGAPKESIDLTFLGGFEFDVLSCNRLTRLLRQES